MPKVRVAACQFATEGDVAANLTATERQIAEAADQGARVAHFSECALTGYAGEDRPDVTSLDWQEVADATARVAELAAHHRLWVLLGSTAPPDADLGPDARPTNCIQVIDPEGALVDRYDKRFCTGAIDPTPTLDLRHYSPGNRPCIFDVDGVRFAVLICYEYRFPELYRELWQQGVQAVCQSFHNARRKGPDPDDLWATVVPATMICRAAENHFWVSATNSVAWWSSWPSFFVRPDGRLAGRAPENTEAVIVADFDTDLDLFDAPGPWRASAVAGQLHSGVLPTKLSPTPTP